MGMKSGTSFNGLGGKRFSLTLIALIGTTIFLWAWEKTPLLTVPSPQNQLEIFSSGLSLFYMLTWLFFLFQWSHNILLLLVCFFFFFGCCGGGFIINGIQSDKSTSLDHQPVNEDVSIQVAEKETNDEQGERNTEFLNEPEVETRNDEAKHSGAALMGSETVRSPENRDDGLTPRFVEKGKMFYHCLVFTAISVKPF